MTFHTHHGKYVLTAKDIAEAIRYRKDRNGFNKALRQVKHWTNSGLLKPVTPLDTGTGISREYVEAPTVLIAAILQELTALGLTVDMMLPIAERLYDDFENGDPDWAMDGAMTGEWLSFLNLEMETDDKGRLTLKNIRLFSTHPESPPLKDSMPQSGGSILVNLPKIASRVKWPGAHDGE